MPDISLPQNKESANMTRPSCGQCKHFSANNTLPNSWRNWGDCQAPVPAWALETTECTKQVYKDLGDRDYAVDCQCFAPNDGGCSRRRRNHSTTLLPLEPEVCKLDMLQASKNDGRGVCCVRTIIAYLKANRIEEASQTCISENDKIRKYPDIQRFLRDKLIAYDDFLKKQEKLFPGAR